MCVVYKYIYIEVYKCISYFYLCYIPSSGNTPPERL